MSSTTTTITQHLHHLLNTPTQQHLLRILFFFDRLRTIIHTRLSAHKHTDRAIMSSPAEIDAAQTCPPCESCYPDATLINLTLSLLRASFSALLIIFPAYKTYKALESQKLRSCQAMLAYWCVTAIINAMKEICDEMLGKYSNYFLWKTMIITIKVLPIIVGPDRMYHYLIRPFFDSASGSIDTAIVTANTFAEEAKETMHVGELKEQLQELKEKIVESVSGSSGDSGNEEVDQQQSPQQYNNNIDAAIDDATTAAAGDAHGLRQRKITEYSKPEMMISSSFVKARELSPIALQAGDILLPGYRDDVSTPIQRSWTEEIEKEL